MVWLLRDFDLLSVILRACTLAFEALTLGGVAFLLLVLRNSQAGMRMRRAVSLTAFGMLVTQLAASGLSVLILCAGSGVPFRTVARAPFFLAASIVAGCALAIVLLLRSGGHARRTLIACVPVSVALLAGSIAMSHAASRLDNRPALIALTAAHHLGMAGWIGEMVFLLLAMRDPRLDPQEAGRMARRYSLLAMISVALLVGSGIGLSYFYIGSWAGLYGSSYGILVVAKTYLLLTMLLLGAANQRSIRRSHAGPAAAAVPAAFLLRLRRFAEAEIGLGFTAVLAAASLTSQAPAVDLAPADRVSAHQIVERYRWESPRLSSPPIAALAPPTTLEAALPAQQFGTGSVSDANDRAWSEYNHHWAGLILLGAALLALASRTLRRPSLRTVAENWPLLFLGLALFILLRADPENWPLGPRPFWASFSRPDVLQHRMYALLISAFAFFEWAVEKRRIHAPWAAYIFPLVVAIGGAALLTHSHSSGDVHEEVLAELSHTPVALLGATAGWARWLELRLPDTRGSRLAAFVWPICLALVGFVLLDYRES